jgi:metal-responsive CopG/Arc/MetJ family transcriptional regulator
MSLVAKTNAPSVRIRFPEKKLLRALDRVAAKNGRSRNSEIIHRLAQSLQADAAQSPAAAA